METIYETYLSLPIDKELLCLAHGDITAPYFCYPVNAKPIGFDGCILYCFLPEYGEMVFACNPESCADQNVYPLAATFEDFIRLILVCGTANPVERYFNTLKNECTNLHDFKTEKSLYQTVEEFKYVEYNHVHPHSFNHYATPHEARIAV